MSIVKKIVKADNINLRKWINFYPLFWFTGIRYKISSNYRTMDIKIPLRWYTRNNNGAMFGGVMLLASDPFPALLFQKIYPFTIAWTKKHSIEYLRPAYSSVTARIEIDDNILVQINNQFEVSKSSEISFDYYFYDRQNNKVAKVTTTCFLKKKAFTS
ncbi:MAG: DUF4442 domain-containing protein [Bacteroidales bacterium]|nr:MAG: DUF4442 domain-containing protein [Bacteroidales bacterium]